MKRDLTGEILKAIRDELRDFRAETGRELADVRGDLSDFRNEVAARVTDSEIRLGTAVLDHAAILATIHARLRDVVDLRPRIEQCESEIRALKESRG